MGNLDGTDKITPTPYDAHERVVRKPHTHSREEGYKAKEEEPVLEPAAELVDEAPEVDDEPKKKGKKGKD